MISKAQSPYRLGRTCQLEVLRLVSIGAYLEWEDEMGVLLPIRYLPEGTQMGDKLEVFVYHDNEGRPIATTLQPFAEVGETAFLECVSVTSAGAFLSWGIHRDLFVPFAEQRTKMQEGAYYAVHLYVDQLSGKIVGSAKLQKHIGNILPDYKVGAEVSALIVEHNDVGYRCVVDHLHWGMIYDEDMPELPHRGDRLRAYVRRVREDGKLDLALRPVGYQRVGGDRERLLELLQKHGGRLPIGDKSPAEEVMHLSGMSKKSFKMAVGTLYRERRIRLMPTSIELSTKNS